MYRIAMTAIISVGLALCVACSGSDRNNEAELARETVADGVAEPALTVLYYFHRTLRCQECLSMELFTGALLRDAFAEEREANRLAYQVVNLDEPGNAHYVDDFTLSFSTLVLADMDAEDHVLRWKELDEAWEKSLDQDAFKSYVREAVARWLTLHDV